MHRVVNHVERILYMVESMWYIEPCCTENILNGWTNVIHRTLLYNNVIWLNFQDSGKWINMVYAADGHVLIVLTFVMFVKNYNNLSVELILKDAINFPNMLLLMYTIGFPKMQWILKDA